MGLLESTSNVQLKKLKEFLDVWPLDRVKNMTLDEYTKVGSKDTFCYWLEYETEILGRIGGVSLDKFGIWNRKGTKELNSIDYIFNDKYAWLKKYGENENQAFLKIREIIVSIIEFSLNGQFSKIDGIKLHSFARWKIAFLYSDLNLLPIYKKEAIRWVAKYHGNENYQFARISSLHKYILAQKPKTIDFFDFYNYCYSLTKKSTYRNYYIIGSKYKDDGTNYYHDIMPYMLKKGVVATGFFWDHDLTSIYGKSSSEVYNWISEHIADEVEEYNNARTTLSMFLQLKPGDIVAVKSEGSFNRLNIIAYAVVKEVDGKVYRNDDRSFPFGLGHEIYVDFVKKDFNLFLGYNYAKTIHQINPADDLELFKEIFGEYSLLESFEVESTGHKETPIKEETDKLDEKQEGMQSRSGVADYTVNLVHNKIQNAFARHLKEKYPNDIIQKEKSRIDVRRISDDSEYLYEIKTGNTAFSCIREAIGQLLDYGYTLNNNKDVKLVVVGTVETDDNDREFLEFIKEKVKISFDYECFRIG